MTLDLKLEQVQEEYLRRLSLGDGELLKQIERHILSRMGKMLRPRLLLMSAQTQGDEAFESRRTLLLAVAVEMLHNASLLHDDVIDHSDSRRGQPSVNAHFGNTAAVLAGDYLLAQVMKILHEVNDPDAAHRINNTVITMVEAELIQLDCQKGPFDSSTYLKIIDGKTASLFATACALGNPDYEEFGLHYGRLFQLRDDVADNEDGPFTAELIEKENAALAAIKHTLPILI